MKSSSSHSLPRSSLIHPRASITSASCSVNNHALSTTPPSRASIAFISACAEFRSIFCVFLCAGRCRADRSHVDDEDAGMEASSPMPAKNPSSRLVFLRRFSLGVVGAEPSESIIRLIVLFSSMVGVGLLSSTSSHRDGGTPPLYPIKTLQKSIPGPPRSPPPSFPRHKDSADSQQARPSPC
jgi:hypothetical protein